MTSLSKTCTHGLGICCGRWNRKHMSKICYKCQACNCQELPWEDSQVFFWTKSISDMQIHNCSCPAVLLSRDQVHKTHNLFLSCCLGTRCQLQAAFLIRRGQSQRICGSFRAEGSRQRTSCLDQCIFQTLMLHCSLFEIS